MPDLLLSSSCVPVGNKGESLSNPVALFVLVVLVSEDSVQNSSCLSGQRSEESGTESGSALISQNLAQVVQHFVIVASFDLLGLDVDHGGQVEPQLSPFGWFVDLHENLVKNVHLAINVGLDGLYARSLRSG